MRLEVFVHFAQPVTGRHLVTRFGKRLEIPQFVVIQREGIFSASQENTLHFIEVVLQTVVVARQHTRS